MCDNWMSLGRRWAARREVHLIDQRNHGRSPKSDQWSYAHMAEDVAGYMKEHGLSGVHLMGHSMGGKTAMHLASQAPDLLSSLAVVDIGPKQYPVHHRTIVQALRSVPLHKMKSRSEVDAFLERSGIPEWGVRQFLMKSLSRDKEKGFEWRFHLEVIDRELQNVGEELLPSGGFDGPVLFIRGGRSGYIEDDDLPGMHRFFPEMELKTVADAGHWVQAERPDQMHDLIQDFMESVG